MKRSVKGIALLLAMLLILCACGDDYSDALRSQGLDKNGYVEGVRALDYIQLCDISSIPVKEDDIQALIDDILETVPQRVQVMDRPVAQGEHVNISYVGTIDGEEFEGGSTGEGGTDITVGQTIYIDTFIHDLKGHMPGETLVLNETFPNYYPANPDLQEKEAVFTVTINYLYDEVPGDFTDEYIAENLSEEYGWTTCDEMRSGVIQELAYEYILNNSPISEVPEAVTKTVQNNIQAYYSTYATYNNLSLNEFLQTYIGATDMDNLIELSGDYIAGNAEQALLFQAIAEKEDMTKITKKEIREYFKETTGYSDFTSFKEIYGMPYIYQVTRNHKVYALLNERVSIQ